MAGGTRAKAGRKPDQDRSRARSRSCARFNAPTRRSPDFSASACARSSGGNEQPAFAEAMERGKARGRVSLRRSLWAWR